MNTMTYSPPGNVIKQELFKFKRLFDEPSDGTIPVLLYPCGLNEILMKGIRIIASKYNMASMNVEDGNIKAVVVFNVKNLRMERKEHWRMFFPYNFNCNNVENIVRSSNSGINVTPRFFFDGRENSNDGVASRLSVGDDYNFSDALSDKDSDDNIKISLYSDEVERDQKMKRDVTPEEQSTDSHEANEVHPIQIYLNESAYYKNITIEIDSSKEESTETRQSRRSTYSGANYSEMAYEFNVMASVQIQFYNQSEEISNQFRGNVVDDKMLKTLQAVRNTIFDEPSMKLLDIKKLYNFVKKLFQDDSNEEKLTEDQISRLEISPIGTDTNDLSINVEYEFDRPNIIDLESSSLHMKCILNSDKSNDNAFGSWEFALTINEKFSKQIKTLIGSTAFVVLATENYLPFKNNHYLRVVELYDIVETVSTEYILKVHEMVTPICKWVDKDRAILMLQTDEDVAKALKIKHRWMKSRSILRGSAEAILTAISTTNFENMTPEYVPHNNAHIESYIYTDDCTYYDQNLYDINDLPVFNYIFPG